MTRAVACTKSFIFVKSLTIISNFRFLEDYFGCAIVDKTSLPKAKFDYADIFKLYGRMFPLYNKRGLLAVPKNLDDLNFEEIAGQLSHNFEVI